jgi:predicted lipid-binding transport protein (Tim44 family)
MTQPGSGAPIGQTAMRPGLFGGGLFGGIAAGFLGAGLFGLLFGHGLFRGMAGFASIIGLLLQVMLVVIVARLIFAWWQRRNMPAPAYAAATGHSFGDLTGMLGGTNASPAGEPITVAKSEYDAFERLLGDIQAAYSAEDRSAPRAKVTSEMLSYFSE